MNLRCLVGNYADPEFHLSRAQQREVTRLAHKKHLAGVTLWTWTIGMTITGWVAFGVTVKPLAFLLLHNGMPRFGAFIASTLILCLAVSLAAAWLYRFIYVKPIRMAMRDLGYDVCVGCGYRLQGLGTEIDRCPECGAVRVAMPENPAANAESPRESRRPAP